MRFRGEGESVFMMCLWGYIVKYCLYCVSAFLVIMCWSERIEDCVCVRERKNSDVYDVLFGFVSWIIAFVLCLCVLFWLVGGEKTNCGK